VVGRDLHIKVAVLFAGEKVERLLAICDALQSERDTNTICCARAPVAMEKNFGHGSRLRRGRSDGK
jgi:hypothetical protein